MDAIRQAIAAKRPLKIVYVRYGRVSAMHGTATAITPYGSMTIRGEVIPFIGPGVAILKITEGDFLTANLLYSAHIPRDYNLWKEDEIHTLRKKIFGKDITDQLARQNGQEREDRELAHLAHHKATQDFKRTPEGKIMSLVRDGHGLILPENQKQWTDLIEHNSNDVFFLLVARAAIEIMRLLETDTIDQAVEKIRQQNTLSPFQLNWALILVADFHGRGEEIEDYRQGHPLMPIRLFQED